MGYIFLNFYCFFLWAFMCCGPLPLTICRITWERRAIGDLEPLWWSKVFRVPQDISEMSSTSGSLRDVHEEEAKVVCRWERANLKPQTECFLGGWTSKLLSQVYDLPQRPGWVLNYTERSLSSQCCLVYAVSSKSPKEMQNYILINSGFRSLFSKCSQWCKQQNIGMTVL